MKPISARNRRIIDSDPFYLACCKCGRPYPQMHHVLYMGRQKDHHKFIVPACGWIVDNKSVGCHQKVDTDRNFKHYFEWIVCKRLSLEEKKEFPHDFVSRETYLDGLMKEHNLPEFPLSEILGGELWKRSY